MKFRCLEERVEKTEDLCCFMTIWLASVLNVEPEVTPTITNAFWTGSANNPERQYPRDIIVTLLDIRVKHKVLSLDRAQGNLPFNN